MHPIQYPTTKEINSLIRYQDGFLYWRVAKGRATINKPIGSKTKNGYLIVNWPSASGRKKLLVHRLVWLLFNGDLPPLIDHINRNKLDNRIENLRALSFSENARNCSDKHYRHALPRGVTLQRGKYKAQIKLNKRTKHIGIYATASEASEAYKNFVAKLKSDGHIAGHPESHE